MIRAQVVGFCDEDALAQEMVFGRSTRAPEGVGEVVEQVADGGPNESRSGPMAGYAGGGADELGTSPLLEQLEFLYLRVAFGQPLPQFV